jgi:hypothetical protein
VQSFIWGLELCEVPKAGYPPWMYLKIRGLESQLPKEGTMHVEVIIRIDGRDVAIVKREITGAAREREEQVEELKQRVGGAVLEQALQEIANAVPRPTCCGHGLKSRGRAPLTVTSLSGEVYIERRRYRCQTCGRDMYPADALICYGRHRMTYPLAKRVCQLSTVEHFTRLEQLVADQHGIHLGHAELLQLSHEAGGIAERERRVDLESWRDCRGPRGPWPEPTVRPRRIYVSCDGIMYCTNLREPDPHHPGEHRLIWQQMKVGCVYWQDEREHWHKRVVWGRDTPEDFGAALFRVACECGYREADERIFTSDGGEWCWDIQARYFSQASGILDWYHANEHVSQAAPKLFGAAEDAQAWAKSAESVLWNEGGDAFVTWLKNEQLRFKWRGDKRTAWNGLLRYFELRTAWTDYPRYRERDWQIGTGMMESTVKQLVGIRLKGPGMHWSEAGALAMTALRAQDLNGRWHEFWNSLQIPA